jgi:hypothetical protein
VEKNKLIPAQPLIKIRLFKAKFPSIEVNHSGLFLGESLLDLLPEGRVPFSHVHPNAGLCEPIKYRVNISMISPITERKHSIVNAKSKSLKHHVELIAESFDLREEQIFLSHGRIETLVDERFIKMGDTSIAQASGAPEQVLDSGLIPSH